MVFTQSCYPGAALASTTRLPDPRINRSSSALDSARSRVLIATSPDMTFRASLLLSFCVAASVLSAADLQVKSPDEFRNAIHSAKPGDRILVAAGEYGGGFSSTTLRGQAGQPIIIAAADPKNPPTFSNAPVGIYLSNPAHVQLENLVFTKISSNGLNIDNGRDVTNDSASHIVLKGLRVSDIGDRGNQDGIKLSGLNDFRVEGCTVERWGRGGGSAIDMVGCHRGVIDGCTFRHSGAESSNGVQCKGASASIRIQRCVFENAGGRAVNVGGNTGTPYFRPALKPDGGNVEAREIHVEGNRFTGHTGAIVFASADACAARFNTIERPARWAFRILQENNAPGFLPCRDCEVTDNVIVFESSRWSEGGVNVGAGTAANTFKFARNWWYCADRPENSRPKLPSAEQAGVYGRDPAEAKGKAGADAWREAPPALNAR